MSTVDISDFEKKIKALETLYRRFPTQIAAIAVKFSKDRFVEQAWFDTHKEAWKPRRQRRKGGKKRSQTLLVDTGRLKKSIRKISANVNTIIIGTDVPYAELHNYGGTVKKTVTVKQHIRKEHIRQNKRSRKKVLIKEHAVHSHTRNMNLNIPQRQFLGNSNELTNQLMKYITEQIENAIKQ